MTDFSSQNASVTAGFKALPTFIKLASFQLLKIASQDIATVYQTRAHVNLLFDALVKVEVDLGPEYQYHSVFACPVSREQSTKDNPPMMLLCGHIIGENLLTKAK